MYLTELTAEQVEVPDESPGWCRVKVRWSYGHQLRDVLQLYYFPGGASQWAAWHQLEVESASDPVEWEGYLLGPDSAGRTHSPCGSTNHRGSSRTARSLL